MKKSYCDACFVEITSKNMFRNFKVDLASVEYCVRQAEALPMSHDMCKYCVLDAIAATDDRPKPYSHD
jgi:hypothetical protein